MLKYDRKITALTDAMRIVDFKLLYKDGDARWTLTAPFLPSSVWVIGPSNLVYHRLTGSVVVLSTYQVILNIPENKPKSGPLTSDL